MLELFAAISFPHPTLRGFVCVCFYVLNTNVPTAWFTVQWVRPRTLCNLNEKTNRAAEEERKEKQKKTGENIDSTNAYANITYEADYI